MSADSPDLPSRLARQLWCDSLTYNREALHAAVELFGRDHVVFGSDYPFLAMPEPLDDIVTDPARRPASQDLPHQFGGALWRTSWVWA